MGKRVLKKAKKPVVKKRIIIALRKVRHIAHRVVVRGLKLAKKAVKHVKAVAKKIHIKVHTAAKHCKCESRKIFHKHHAKKHPKKKTAKKHLKVKAKAHKKKAVKKAKKVAKKAKKVVKAKVVKKKF